MFLGNTLNSRDITINWQFHFVPLPRPNPHLRERGWGSADEFCSIEQFATNNRGNGTAIALTAYAGEINQQQAIAAGFQRHLAKPVEPEALVKVIADLTRANSIMLFILVSKF
jgi:hypothetical protein